ncbi:type-F conjugative transfer system protein TraW [Novosphingobium sp. CCH12-A3]|uniref:type-F conjugative transfer system protein TraW n=1 Tax=Novosphingobium sp. CCH12-A3 TaxID=1768752 RepID=UPI0007802218|nr:type-F conjugative transfer system protein TraW [Novosphingobium sp. CCH12-A3]
MLTGAANPASVSPSQSQGHDLGRFGETWPVIEPDLLSMIAARLKAAQGSGQLDQLNRAFAARAEARVMNPTPVGGLSPATKSRSWTYDPAMTLSADIRDAKGVLIAARGTRINPLDLVTLPRMLLFVDGTSDSQVAWAQAQGDDAHVSIILVAGSPFARMRALKRRVWFDQGGTLTARFGIAHTPVLVRQRGKALQVDEVALPPEAHKDGDRT